MFRSLLLAAIGTAAFAQTQIDLSKQARRVDFSGAASTKPVKTGTSLPPACEVGEVFFKSDSEAGSNLFACTASDHWSVLGGNGSLTVQSEGVTGGSAATANFIAGPGMTQVISQAANTIHITSALDTALVQTQGGAQRGTALLCASSGTSGGSYQCSIDPALSNYTAGMVLHWIPDIDGIAGGATLNIDYLGATALKTGDGVTDPPAGTIRAGHLYLIWYDGTHFRMVAEAQTATGSAVASVFGRTGAVISQSGDYTTAQVAEAGNLYFTDARARNAVTWSTLSGVPSTFPAASHASTHQNGGADEVSTATPLPNAIPKADGVGTLASGWLPGSVRTRAFGYSFDGGGSILSAGKVGYLTIPFPCTISAWNIVVDTGSASFDLWKVATGTSAPTVANSITATAAPSIGSGTAARSTALTGWTKSVSANDIIGIQLKTVGSATFANLTVECDQ